MTVYFGNIRPYKYEIYVLCANVAKCLNYNEKKAYKSDIRYVQKQLDERTKKPL